MGKSCLNGRETLDNQMKVLKKTMLYIFELPPAFTLRHSPPDMVYKLCSLSNTIVHVGVKEIVENVCRKDTGELAVNFIEYHKKQNTNALLQAGLPPVQCDTDQFPQFQNEMSGITTLPYISGDLALRLHGLQDPRPELADIFIRNPLVLLWIASSGETLSLTSIHHSIQQSHAVWISCTNTTKLVTFFQSIKRNPRSTVSCNRGTDFSISSGMVLSATDCKI